MGLCCSVSKPISEDEEDEVIHQVNTSINNHTVIATSPSAESLIRKQNNQTNKTKHQQLNDEDEYLDGDDEYISHHVKYKKFGDGSISPSASSLSISSYSSSKSSSKANVNKEKKKKSSSSHKHSRSSSVDHANINHHHLAPNHLSHHHYSSPNLMDNHSNASSAVNYSSLLKNRLDKKNTESTGHLTVSSPSLLTLSLKQEQQNVMIQRMREDEMEELEYKKNQKRKQQSIKKNNKSDDHVVVVLDDTIYGDDEDEDLELQFSKSASESISSSFEEHEVHVQQASYLSSLRQGSLLTPHTSTQSLTVPNHSISSSNNMANRMLSTTSTSSIMNQSHHHPTITIEPPLNLPKVIKVNTKKKKKNKTLDYSSDDMILFKVILIGDANVGKSSCLARIEGNPFSTLTRSTDGLEFTTRLIENNNNNNQMIDNAASPKTHNNNNMNFKYSHKIQLQFWDTGHSSFVKRNDNYNYDDGIVEAYFQDVQAIICVYSIISVSSFEQLKQLWYYQVLPNLVKHKYLPNIRVILLGNKTDLDAERAVDYVQGLEFAKQIENSIKNSIVRNNDNMYLASPLINDVEQSQQISHLDEDIVKFYECSAKSGQNLEIVVQTLAHDLDNYFSNFL
ncbi:hypothetical protein ABK040_013148 [Willaertia magna]